MRGGVRLSAHKDSASTPIVTAKSPQRVALPLDQHAATVMHAVVKAGDKVLMGQAIALPSDAMGPSLHSPVSGVVNAIHEQPSPQHLRRRITTIHITSDGKDERDSSVQPINNPLEMSPRTLREHIAHGGIAGLGGAVFPTAAKLTVGDSRDVTTLIVNGAECEPFIACDDALMRERAPQIVDGVQLLLHACGAGNAIIAVENTKTAAIEALRAALKAANDSRLTLIDVPTIYPAGGERQLIQTLLSKEVPSGALPADIGVICHNVGTAAAVANLIRTGEPLISRIVTVTGSGIKAPRNVEARLGASITSAIEECGGYAETPQQLIMGGPMMGLALPSDSLPIVKATNCIVAATAADLQPRGPTLPCIRCGECATACPANLLPQELLRHIRNDHRKALHTLGLADCIECGCCDYVCPSQIPLASAFIVGKRTMLDNDPPQT
jgi:electron transport complex protein RnfC